MSQWQAIETAPAVDGRVVLICYEAWNGPRVVTAYYRGDASVGARPWYCDIGYVKATHWMPLPDPPVGSHGKTPVSGASGSAQSAAKESSSQPVPPAAVEGQAEIEKHARTLEAFADTTTQCFPSERAAMRAGAAALRASVSPIQNQVICAAIKLADGTIIRGHRHDGCFKYAEQVGIRTPDRFKGHVQGFIDARNQFVDREEAMRIQLAAGIPTADPKGRGGYREGNGLFSEDLY